jgi:glycosyltransferase 2 family protein
MQESPERKIQIGYLTHVRRMLSSSPWLATTLKIAFTLAMLAVALRSVDFPAAWKYASEQNDWFLFLAAALLAFQIACGACRWQVILRALNAVMPFVETARIYYIGAFFGTCMVASVGGDVARGWLMYRNNIRVGTAAISVILDRVAALTGVAIIILAVTPFFVKVVGRAYFAPALIFACLAAAGLLGIVIVAQLDRISVGRLARFRLLNQLATLGAATRQVFLRPTTSIPVLALGVATQLGGSLAAYAIARSLALNVTATECLILMQPVTLLATLPISIGGWGVREAAVVTFFGLVGVAPSAAVLLSVQLGLLAVVLSLPGGLLFLVQRRRSGIDIAEIDPAPVAPRTQL